MELFYAMIFQLRTGTHVYQTYYIWKENVESFTKRTYTDDMILHPSPAIIQSSTFLQDEGFAYYFFTNLRCKLRSSSQQNADRSEVQADQEN